MTETQNIFDMSRCTLCPRACGADRLRGQTGLCRTDARIHAALAYLHRWEEPCLTGRHGSGTVFFTGCGLGCVFCQNRAISAPLQLRRRDASAGSPVAADTSADGSPAVPGAAADVVLTPERLAGVFLSLQEQGAANINLVTAGHQLPAILPALSLARAQGLSIPYVYNSSGYERAEAVRALEGLVDIYLPDMKFFSPELSRRYAAAPDYFEAASAAIDEMVRQQPRTVFAETDTADGTAGAVGAMTRDAADDAESPALLRGVIVRILVLPGQTEDAKRILSFLFSRYGNDICYSILNQYTPAPEVTAGAGLTEAAPDPLLSRPLTAEEYDEVTDHAVSLGIENGFVQEGETVSESFIPEFDGRGLL